MKEKGDSKGTDSLLKYKQYALDVVQHKQIACKYVIQACERYLSWFERDDFIFRPEKADACTAMKVIMQQRANKQGNWRL